MTFRRSYVNNENVNFIAEAHTHTHTPTHANQMHNINVLGQVLFRLLVFISNSFPLISSRG